MRLVRSFSWLELWGKTPAELGARPDQVDPAWEEAVIILKNALEAERKAHYDSL